jgi:tripartite-type tricarboxylate transporter receptor subunit TctC
LPDVPTVAESGFPGYSFAATAGIVVPAATPAEIIALLNREMASAMSGPDLKGWTEANGSEVVNSTPGEFGAYMRSEHQRYGRLVRELGLGTPK